MRQVVTMALILATIAVNGLANALPINGQPTGAISDRFVVYFTPAGYVFSIWGVIYLGLIAYGVFQALPRQRDNPALKQLALPFWISCLANIGWILLWHYGFFATTLLVMLVLLGSLVLVYRTLNRYPQRSLGELICVRLPFSIYIGWITVATIANLTVVMEDKDLRPFGMGAEPWALGMVMLGTIVAAAVGWIRRDVAYLLVIVWAFTGIVVKQGGGMVGVAAAVGVAVALLLILRSLIVGRPAPSPS
jgi:hypothetical protein